MFTVRGPLGDRTLPQLGGRTTRLSCNDPDVSGYRVHQIFPVRRNLQTVCLPHRPQILEGYEMFSSIWSSDRSDRKKEGQYETKYKPDSEREDSHEFISPVIFLTYETQAPSFSFPIALHGSLRGIRLRSVLSSLRLNLFSE